MPQRRKHPQAAENTTVAKPASAPIPTPGQWKGKAIGFLFALIILAAIWSTGVFKEFFAGPKIPLPREAGGLTLGMTLDEVQQRFPNLKKKMRPFNNDPQFKIVTLDASAGVTGATTLDLLFHIPSGKLYFISAMWEGDGAKAVPVDQWAKQYRRWNKDSSGNPEPLGNDVLLKEWHFNDVHTEMVLRDLDYSNHLQRWQDLRDASNDAAQQAFAKYRLDTGS
jgi:hypothetical protein